MVYFNSKVIFNESNANHVEVIYFWLIPSTKRDIKNVPFASSKLSFKYFTYH